MGTLNENDGFENMEAPFKPTAYEVSMIETEERLQKMLSSPLIESLERHEAMMASILSSPALHAIESQLSIPDNLQTITNAIAMETKLLQPECLTTQSLIKSAACSFAAAEIQISQLDCLPSLNMLESVSRSLDENPMYGLAASLEKALVSFNDQYCGVAESLAKSLSSHLSQLALPDNAFRGMLESITQFGSVMFSAAEQVALAMSGITDSCLRGISAMADAFSGFDLSPLMGLSDGLSNIADFEKKNEVLKSFGWYMIAELPEEVVDEIYGRRDQITQEEVDALIVQYFRNNRCQELKSIVSNWKHLPYFKTRQIVFHEAQVCHSRRSFNASTTLISLQFEGVVTDFVRDRIMAPTYRKWAEKALVFITDLTNELTMAAMPLEEWIVCSYVLECVDEVFNTSFSPADPNSCPNTSRHKIAHGHATAKETEANSLRRFLFMNELYKLFCCLENEYQLAS